MTLEYIETTPLQVPNDAFNADDIAVILITGGSYGGMWVLNALPVIDGTPQGDGIGAIQTAEAPQMPDLALEAAAAWVTATCQTAGWKLAHWRSENGNYSISERPFFSSGVFFLDRRA